jgi:uncharacterized membrane protein
MSDATNEASREATKPESGLPPSVNENIGTIAEFHARHEDRLSTTQKLMEKIALFLGSPAYVAGNVILVILWVGANLLGEDLGWKTFDPPPFSLLQGIVTLNAFVISTTVLIRQNRMSRLADHHAHLDLQVNLLTEEKSSKIIALLEELRYDMPNVRNKTDREADELAKSADAKAVLSAIERGAGGERD